MNGSSGIFDLGIQAVPGDIRAANPSLNVIVGTNAAAMTAALTPTFTVIEPVSKTYPLASIMARVTTLSAANTLGCAVYSITYTDLTHWTASLVCQLNAALSTAATGMIKGDVTTGAAGSGAAVATLDFTTTRYIIGSMASDLVAAFTGWTGSTTLQGQGIIRWTAAARSGTTDWPSSFTETSSANINASRVNALQLVTATGKIIP